MGISAASPTAAAGSPGSGSIWSAILSRLSTSDPDSRGPQFRFYGRRKGKPLKPNRQALLDQVLPKLLIGEAAVARDPRALFQHAPQDIWLEVGFGGGEHLAAQATANPVAGIIGCEVFLNGVASLVRHVDERKLNNVRVWHGDVRELLPNLPDGSIARVFVLYPDPWPKARHAKRRLIGPDSLPELARILADGGELRFASDHPVYVRWALQHLTAAPEFHWQARTPEDWRTRPADQIETRYEAKAKTAGRTPSYLTFLRRPRA
ncbi:MAG: tRNA (guanosine(46)-N7)-methyltransferase TrmB [Rhodobacteraceae bacterium]|nr:tRNA (guanosine(46)-N7)-methyltransferase TrmB [Paracoccaceae bacterium]